MSCRIGSLCAIVSLILCVSGCGLMQSAKSVTRESMKSIKVRPNDNYRDSSSENEAEWNSVGRTARAVRGVETSDDPLRRFRDPKAISIERNLGIE